MESLRRFYTNPVDGSKRTSRLNTKYFSLCECRFPVPYTPVTEVHLIHIREGPALKGTGLEQRDEFGLKEIENIVRARGTLVT